MGDGRRPLLIDIEHAVDGVRDGMTIGLSGFAYQNAPMAIVREIIRRGIRDLTLVSGPTSGIETDLLIGAGCVSTVVTAGVSLERVAGIGPAFRHGVESGDVRVWECDECIWYVALQAAAWGVPYLLWPGGVGTSLPDLNPDLLEVREGNRTYLRVPPIRPEIVFIHAAEADPFGNVRESPRSYLGRSFAERALAEACAGPLIATVERVVENAEVVAAPEWTTLRGARIALAPWGAHPAGTSGRYVPDLGHVMEYGEAGRALLAGDPLPYDAYLRRFVHDQPGHSQYVDTIGQERLASLEMRVHLWGPRGTRFPRRGASRASRTICSSW